MASAQPDTGATGALRRRLIVGGSVIALVLGGWWLYSRSTASGDPGGRILSQLAPAASALPGYGTPALPWSSQPSVSQPFLIKSEPHRDSCDGMSGTGGWSEVVVQGAFRWSGTHEVLFDQVGSRLTALGWRRVTIPTASDEAVWKRKLDSKSTATAMLNVSPTGDPNWEFDVTAPPAGNPATGC
jgi:hypothetical protein